MLTAVTSVSEVTVIFSQLILVLKFVNTAAFFVLCSNWFYTLFENVTAVRNAPRDGVR